MHYPCILGTPYCCPFDAVKLEKNRKYRKGVGLSIEKHNIGLILQCKGPDGVLCNFFQGDILQVEWERLSTYLHSYGVLKMLNFFVLFFNFDY